MSRQIKRKVSSFTYFMQKAYWKIITAKPSLFAIGIIAIAVSIFLLGGGIYDILEQPLVAVIQSGGALLGFYPRYLNEQFWLESIRIMILYTLGVAGLLLMYQGTKYASIPRQAYMMLFMGAILVAIAYILVENGLLAKFSTQ